MSAKQQSFKVTFVDVGRSKRTWTVTLNKIPTEPVLTRLVRKSGALMSRDVECAITEDGTDGLIFAGLHAVGAFNIEALE